MDVQGAAEMIYLPEAIRKDKEIYGQVESHVKRVYGARIGWMGWDVYDINPLSKARFSSQVNHGRPAVGSYWRCTREQLDRAC